MSGLEAGFGLAAVALVVQACANLPPRDIDDLCEIFAERPAWERATASSAETWGVPASVQLAIIHQESRFRPEARPGWRRLLWVLPVGRLSSAYGYGQVKDGTWGDYQERSSSPRADRTDFADVSDFIGWYASVIGKATGITPHDAYNLYLGYHEGPAGYARGNHREKAWLLDVASKVEGRADLYAAQHTTCGGPAPPSSGVKNLR